MESIKKNSKVLFYVLCAIAILVPSVYFALSGKASKVNIQPYSGIGSTSDKELNLTRYNWADEGTFPVKVRNGAILFVGLDPEGRAMMPVNGELNCGDKLVNWKPTVGSLPYSFAVMSDTAVAAEDGTNYKYSWYSPSTRQLRYAFGDDNEYNKLIIATNIAQQNSTGVYKQELTALFNGSAGQTIANMKDQWRGIITSDKQQQSKQLWRYIAGSNGTGIEDRLYKYLGYTDNMLSNMNDLNKWTDEEMKNGFISYLDLLMTAYSCASESPEAQQYWGTCIDRYIAEGTAPNSDASQLVATIPFNLTIIPGTAVVLPRNPNTGAESMVAVTGCMDIWDYAYQIQTIFDASNPLLADDLSGEKNYGGDGFYNPLARITKANIASLNMEPNEFPVTLKPVYSLLNKCFSQRYNVATGEMEKKSGTIVDSFNTSINRGVDVGVLTGSVNAFALPQTLNMAINPNPNPDTPSMAGGAITGDFKVVWANEDAAYKSISPANSNVGDSVRFRMNFATVPTEEAVWRTISATYKEFRMFIKPKRVYDVSVDVKGGGTETRNKANAERYSPTKGANGIEVKLTNNEFLNLVLGRMPYLQTYDISTLNQSLQLGEMLTLGYDLEVEFAWYTDGVEKGRVSTPLAGYSKIEANSDTDREQKAETSPYILTVYREEEHTNTIVYSTEPTAYAEIKQGTVEMDSNGAIEDYEAMAGVPTTEYLYYASGGSEFVLEFELEYIEGEKGVRWYNSQFQGTECEFKHNDQWKPIEAKGTTDENNTKEEITILKEKFVADADGKDYPEAKEVDAQWYNGYIPGGASSYSVNLVGHATCTNGTDSMGDGYSDDSAPITATWTGLITNPRGETKETAGSSSHIAGFDKGNVKPPEHGGYIGKPGTFAETDTTWDVTAYHKALYEALNWAKAYEKTNETFTAMKWADSDNYERIWKIGDATIVVSFKNGESNQDAGTRPAGTYNTDNLIDNAKKDGTLANFGYNFSFTAGKPNTTGKCTPAKDGPPPVPHSDTTGTDIKPSTVEGAGDINYTIAVTFPKSSNGTNKLTAHELCGTCCTHMLRGLHDTWSQYSQYDYTQFKACRVYKIHRSYVDGMEEITFADYGKENSAEAGNHLMASGPINSYTYFTETGKKGAWLAKWRDGREVISAKTQAEKHNGTDTIVGAITQGDPNIFYNIALMNNAQDTTNRTPCGFGKQGGNTGYSYAFEVRQQKLEREGKEVPDKDLTDWPDKSGIIRSAQNSAAGRIRYSLLPNQLSNIYIVEASQRGNACNSKNYDAGGFIEGVNETLATNPIPSRSNKCDGVGFWNGLPNYGGKVSNNMFADTTKNPLNPIQVKANGHKKPIVVIPDADLLGDKGSGGLTPNENITDIPNFSVGCLYADSANNDDSNRFDNTYSDDEFYLQTLTRPDDRTCTTVAIEGTAETNGQYQSNDNNVVKNLYNASVDWYDYQSEEYYRFRFRRNQTNKMFVISDMLILQTSTGDQPVMYHWKSQTKRAQQHYDYTSADVEPRMAAVDSFTGTNITLKEDFKNMWYNQRAGDKTKTEDWYTATAMGWGVNNIGQEGQINVGGYTGNYSEPDNKYSNTGLDLVTFNANDKYNVNKFAEYWTRFPEGFSTVFDHTADTYDPNDLDVFIGHLIAGIDGYGWGVGWPEYLKGAAYLDPTGKEGAFYGCAKENNKGYSAFVEGGPGEGCSSIVQGSLGRWHWGAVVDTSARDPYKASPNQRLDAAFHSPNALNNRSGESRMSNVSGLRIVTDMIEQDPTNPNKEYKTGDAYQTYINILDWPKVDNGELLDGLGKGYSATPEFNRNEFQDTKKAGLAGNIRRQRFFDEDVYKTDEDAKGKVKGLIIDATYSDDHTKINNIVVQNPISVQNALIVHNEAAEKNGWYSDTRTTDISTFTKETLDDKKDKLEVCPKDDTCEFKVLNCKYFNDITYLSLDFNKDSGANVDSNGYGEVHNLAYDTEKDPSIKQTMKKDVELGDFRIVDKIRTKTPAKDDPTTPDVNEALDKDKNQIYTYQDIQPFGASNKQFLEAVVEGKGGARLSIPLDKLGVTRDSIKSHKLSVEFDLYMDTVYKEDGKTYREPTMLVGFNGLGFYLPKIQNGEHQKNSFTSGNGVEKYTTLFDTYGSSNRIRLEWDFTSEGATKSKLFYNGREITGFNTENNSNPVTTDMIFGNGEGTLNIGCWTKSNEFVSRFYMDNLKVVLKAGTAQHTDACYDTETVYESSTMYLCTTPRIWDTKDWATARPYVWTVPADGKYKLQAWGATGGGWTTDSTKSSHGGLGGYSSGYVSLKKGEQLMIYPGSSGEYTNTGADYEYLWTIDSLCGAGDRYSLENGTMSGGEIINISSLGQSVKYVNSVTGKDATPIAKGIWSSTNPNPNACTNHSFSVAIYTSGPASGNMVKRLSKSGTSTSIGSITNFSYTGGVQEYTVPADGDYKLEAWGASGGYYSDSQLQMAGEGGYTSGTVHLTKGTKLYIYVGNAGKRDLTTPAPATFNGGGDGGTGMTSKGDHLGGSGGGATDFRLVNGTWNALNSLQSRILVAGGGGGAGCASNHNPGHGGGLVGKGTVNLTGTYAGAATDGGSQHNGGGGSGKYTGTRGAGRFGAGANAIQCGAGGGGGYYGGGSEYTAGGSGGSSFVTGYTGCDTTYRNQHRGLVFNNVSMTQGGNVGTGKAKITQLLVDATSRKDYGFTGGVQKFVVPKTGDYTLETWGAQGGGNTVGYESAGGLGGYAKRVVKLNKGDTIYIYVGGQGTLSTALGTGGGWNGGGHGGPNGFGGGGMTHMSTMPNLASAQANGGTNTGSKTFNYTGGMQSFTAPATGTYNFKLFGATGNGVYTGGVGGKGGTTTGNISLTAGQTIYIGVGGSGIDHGGWNGGQGAQPGGGATHIASENRGELYNYENFKNEVYLVAGGGGAAERVPGGDGGGTTGGAGSSAYSGLTKAPGGGTQTAGGTYGISSSYGNGGSGTFGRGGSGAGSGKDTGPTGGAGWYGGGGIPYAGGAGGGSGYVNTSLVTSGSTSTSSGTASGDGQVVITWNISQSSGTWKPNETLLVAGGGGGADNTGYSTTVYGGNDDGAGGHGGGTTGGNAKIDGIQKLGTGATQTSGFMQGVGESVTLATDTGGAGAGWCGGFVTNHYNGGAGGGSGYAPSGVLMSGTNTGNGRASISWVGSNSANTWAGAGFNGGGSGGAGGYGGGGASDVRKITSGGEFKLGTSKPSNTIETYNGVDYVKVFDHDSTTGGFFTSKAEALSCNKTGKFSLLNQLDALKGSGKYQFMLYYPETGKRNIWKQSKNPTEEWIPNTDSGSKVSGYEPIQIDMSGNYWGGLALASQNGTGSTFLDGSTGHGNWYYAIGATTKWGTGEKTFPGGNNTSVTKVQLYLACDESLAGGNTKDAVMSESGSLTYGPYITAQPGTYQVDIYGDGFADCTFDVYSNQLGGIIYKHDQLLDFKVSPKHVSFYFNLDKPITKASAGLEVRVHHEDSDNYKFEAEYLSRLDDRLIVAGGGGGADDSYSQDAAGGANDGSGGYGGELIAEKAKVNGVYVVPGQALTESGVMAGSKLQGSIDLIKDKTHGTWKALEGINFSGCGMGGGQDYGYALGRGESVSYNTDTGGAGGGYYGGYVTNHGNGGAGGGSNFLSQSLSDTHQEGANNPGQGKVMIQLTEHELSQGNMQLFGFQPVSGLANQTHQGSKRINGKVQEWTVPETGEYKLEVWGASGGDGRLFNTPNVIKGTGGKGGYSSAYVTLTAGTKLYIYVGGQGNDSNERDAGTYGAGGWNGGGDGGTKLGEYDPEHGAGGGGMTHISLSSEDNIEADKFDRNKVIVVAGAGGGGASYAGQKQESSGGEGGGTWGYSYSSYSIPGGQDAKSGSGKAYGNEGYTDNSAANRDGSGGNGAGWYGGGRPKTLPPTDREAGAGGSGYINTNFTIRVNGTVFPLVAGQLLSGRDIQPKPVALTAGVEATGQYVQTGNVGNGAARITKVERGHNADCETEVTQGEKPANVHEHKIDCLLAPNKANYYYEDEYKVVDGKAPGKTGKLEGAIRQYVSGNHKPLEALLSVTVANKVAGSLPGYVNSNNIDGAVRSIATYINSIPYDSEAFMCGGYPLNTFDESKAKSVTQRVLKCVEPHHTGGHYQTDKQAIDATGSADATSCYDPCENDANHKKTPQGAHVDASTVAGATYINTDEYFDLYFPTTGDFYESKDLGIPHTQQIKGKGYVDNMDTKEWIRERYVKFDFDTLFYRTETGLWEQYSANEWIELPVKNGHDEGVKNHYENDQYEKEDRTVTDGKGNTINTKKEDWYSFYCTLNNNEKGAATITFEAEAINNASGSKGKYYPRDKYPILGSNNIKSQSLSEKFFIYEANAKHPGEVFGNDYKYTRVFDRESLQDKEWVDFPFMVWKENSTGDWYQNTSKNREAIGFKGGKETYLVREQDRYNRVFGPIKDKTKENPATNHRNDNDNKNEVTNEKRKGNLTALHGAHLVQTTDLVGRIGNFMITNTTDVRFANFFKVPKNDGTYLINGIVQDIHEGLQRNYFSWHRNKVAGNRESLARDVRNRWVGETVAKDPGFNWLYDTWKTQYWKSARGPSNELTYNPSNGAKLDTSNPATEPAKGSGTDKMKYGPLSTPISSDKNNLAVYQGKELLKPGYTVNYEITTTGNYASKLQIKPYFYALSLSNKNDYPKGTIVPVDVYMLTDKEYQPINLWGYEDITKDGKQKFPSQGLQVYDYMLSLNWQEEKTQRMITPREDTLSTLVHKTMFENVTNGVPGIDNDEGYFLRPVAIPQGDFFKLGNLQLQRVYNSARTFIGQNLTSYENFVFDRNKETNRDGVDLSDTNFEGKFDLEDYAYRAQRWHLKLGLPSSAVFTVYNGANRIKPTDEVYAKVNGDDITWGKVGDTDEGDNAQHKVLGMDVIKNGDYAILMTANIRALGPIWNLYYTQKEDNGVVNIKGTRYSFTTDNFLKITNPENWQEDKSNSQVLIAVYNGSDTSSLDVDMIGTH